MLARRSSSASISRSRASAAREGGSTLEPSSSSSLATTSPSPRERTMRSSRGSRAGSSPERICATSSPSLRWSSSSASRSVVARPRPRAALTAPASAAAAQHAEGCSIHPASACFEQLTTYPSQSRSVGGSSSRVVCRPCPRGLHRVGMPWEVSRKILSSLAQGSAGSSWSTHLARAGEKDGTRWR